jgi:hypothetical protein
METEKDALQTQIDELNAQLALSQAARGRLHELGIQLRAEKRAQMERSNALKAERDNLQQRYHEKDRTSKAHYDGLEQMYNMLHEHYLSQNARIADLCNNVRTSHRPIAFGSNLHRTPALLGARFE